MSTLEQGIDSIVAAATPGQVVLARSRDDSCTKLILRPAGKNDKNDDEPLLQVNLYHEGDLDLFVDAHYGLTELDGTDFDTRKMIYDWTKAVLFSGYEELVARIFGQPIKLALRLNSTSPTLRTRGFWAKSLGSSKRWVSVRPFASIDAEK